MRPLIDEILDSVPAGTYCFPALLRIVEIVETDKVPTAAVECVPLPRMLVNPEFVSRHASTPEKLAMLMLHELHHVILGHTRLHRRVTKVDNLAFDAVINAMLCRLLPDPRAIAFLTDFYDESSLPGALLRPVSTWRPEQTVRGRGDSVISAYSNAHQSEIPWAHLAPHALVEAYRGLYWGDGCTYSELLEALAASGSLDADVQLIGDHEEESAGASSGGGLERRSPALLQEVRKIVERWPQPPAPIAGRSWNAFVETGQKPRSPTPRSQLRNAILAVARGGHAVRGRHSQPGIQTVDSPVPRMARRTLVQRALGHEPLLYPAGLPAGRRRTRMERVHVYLDTSGSVEDLAGHLLGAVHSVRDLVHPLVHQFSTRIASVTMSQLARGVWRTTGGTCLDCVAEHMQASDVRRALIVTDGYVGDPGAMADRWLRRVRLAIALTPGKSSRAPLDRYTQNFFEIPRHERQEAHR